MCGDNAGYQPPGLSLQPGWPLMQQLNQWQGLYVAVSGSLWDSLHGGAAQLGHKPYQDPGPGGHRFLCCTRPLLQCNTCPLELELREPRRSRERQCEDSRSTGARCESLHVTVYTGTTVGHRIALMGYGKNMGAVHAFRKFTIAPIRFRGCSP